MKFPNSLSLYATTQFDSTSKRTKELTAIASAILMVALVSSRILCMRHPSFPMTLPIWREGTTILNMTSCPLARFAADWSIAAAVPGASSSRRRFPEDAAAGSWTEKGIWSGMGSGICICMGMGMGICICICMCMDMGTCMAAIGFCGGTMGFIGIWPCCDIAASSLQEKVSEWERETPFFRSKI